MSVPASPPVLPRLCGSVDRDAQREFCKSNRFPPLCAWTEALSVRLSHWEFDRWEFESPNECATRRISEDPCLRSSKPSNGPGTHNQLPAEALFIRIALRSVHAERWRNRRRPHLPRVRPEDPQHVQARDPAGRERHMPSMPDSRRADQQGPSSLNLMQRFLIFSFLVLSASLMAQLNGVSGERIRAHVKFLASDLLEGRGPGARGGDLAAEYIAAQLALIGAKPAGDNGTYFQNFTLVGVAPQADTQLTAVGSGGQQVFKWLDDFVGVTDQQKADATFDGDGIFVGHGITAPEYQWDDYKDTDVRGKVVVLFTNEPPSTDPKFFTGPALTYYGRWTYKYEEATRHGAAAVIIIHTTPTASYGWEVVRSSWGREDQQVKLDPGAPALAFAGWVTTAVGERIAGTIGKTVDQLLTMANTRGFKPITLPFKFRGHAPAKIREVKTRNVVGRIECSDPVLKH